MSNFEKQKKLQNQTESVEEKELHKTDPDAEKQIDSQSVGNETNFGKFKDAAELLKAYENLEREFTKKSQRLKELENSFNRDNEELSPRQILPTANPQKDSSVTDGVFVDNPAYADENYRLKNLLSDRDFIEQYVLNNDELAKTVLKRYINALSQSDLPSTINSRNGCMSLTPPNRPKSIKEASRMAEKYFNK